MKSSKKMVGIENFSEYTYSKKNHFKVFGDLDLKLYKEKKNPMDYDLKVYQDLLVLAFIKANISKGSRILEIGGGNSRIIRHCHMDYEIWNLDKFEGFGNGPREVKVNCFRLIRDYIGNFNSALPNAYFDFVFSISVLEHIPQDKNELFRKILDDINRLVKPGGFSLHCVDALVNLEKVWVNPLLKFIFKNQETINPFIDLSWIKADPDTYFMSESAFQRSWAPFVKKKYNELGKPFSYNVLWKKE